MSGKILVIKNVILPIILCIALIFPPSGSMIKKLLFVFFWGSKYEKAKRDIAVRKKKLGGLDFPNLKIYIGINYICYFVDIFKKENKAACMQKYLAGTMVPKAGVG